MWEERGSRERQWWEGEERRTILRLFSLGERDKGAASSSPFPYLSDLTELIQHSCKKQTNTNMIIKMLRLFIRT